MIKRIHLVTFIAISISFAFTHIARANAFYVSPDYLVLASGDYDGDGKSDIALFRPDSGLWAVKGLGRIYFGRAGDGPVTR